MTWGSGFIDSWSNPANQPSGASHWVGVQALHYTNAYNSAYGWQLVGGPITGLRFRNFWNTATSWKTITMYGVNEGVGDLYATRYYSSDSTGYYMDPSERSVVNEIGALKMRADSNGNYSDNNGWWIHDVYGQGWGKPHGSFRTLEVSTSGNFSTEPAMFRIHQWGSGAAEFWKPQGTTLFLRETPLSTGGGKHGNWFTRFYVDRYIESEEDMRAPIFYDSNNTTYRVDPNGSSRLSSLQVDNTIVGNIQNADVATYARRLDGA
jgi:hypothetical protein